MTFVSRRSRGLAGFAVLIFLGASVGAQPPASDPSFSGSLDVQEAEVEVLVTDRDGKPVPGLTREDFRVLEDGQPVEIASVSSTADQPIVLAVFLDETSLVGPARASALSGLRRFFASSLRPGDRALLVRWDGSLEIHGEPTGDVTALAATLDMLGKAPVVGAAPAQERGAMQREISDIPALDDEIGRLLAIARAKAVYAQLRAYSQSRADMTRATLGALQQTLALLSSLPERKALLYVGGGIPLRPAANLFDAWTTKFSAIAAEVGASPFEASRWDASPLVKQTVDRANAAAITLHALALPASGTVNAADRQATGTGVGDPEDAVRAIRNLADGTGGRVTADVQNPAAFLEGTGRDVAGSYSLGYTPPSGKNGKHKIEVTVRGGALAARYREERLDGGAVNPLLRRAMAALWAGVAGATGAAGEVNPLKAELSIEEETREDDGRYRVTAVVALPLAGVLVQPQENFHVAHLTVAVAARDGKGRISGLPHADFPVEIPNDHLLSAPGQSAGYRFTLHLAPGDSVVAVALRDDMGGAESVVRIALTPGKPPGAVKP
jgi:VWFA-related protein